MHRNVILLALVAGCEWGGRTVPGETWAPADAVAVADGLLAPLPAVHGLLWALPDGSSAPVDLDEGVVYGLLDARSDNGEGGDAPSYDTWWEDSASTTQIPAHRLQPLPDGVGVLARTTRLSCEEPLRKRDSWVDCPSESRAAQHELVRLVGGAVQGRWDLPLWYAEPVVSADGRWAVAFVDPNAPVSGGLVSLDRAVLINLAEGTSRQLAAGTDAATATFAPDANGALNTLVLLAPGEIRVFDLASGGNDPTVTFPLTLGVETSAVPTQAVLTPDAAYALVTLANSADLYVLDLLNRSINIVGLRAVPSQLWTDVAGDRTWIAYGNQTIDRLDHARFELAPLSMPHRVSALLPAGEGLLAWRPGYADAVSHVDPASDRVQSFDLDAATTRLVVSPDASLGLAIADSALRARVDVLRLTPDGDGNLDEDGIPFALDAALLDARFTSDATGSDLWIAQVGQPSLYVLDGTSLGVTEIALEEAPLALLPRGAGAMVTTHDAWDGLVSWIAADATVVTTSGFADDDILKGWTLPFGRVSE